MLPFLAHVYLTGCGHQRLGTAFMHLISAVIFSRACVLVILDLSFDFSDRTKTLEQMAPCLAGSDLLQILS